MSVGTWLMMAYMVDLPVYVAYMVGNWALARRGAVVASSFTLLVPVASGVLSVVFLSEGFDAVKAIGAVVILAGLIILQRPRLTMPKSPIGFDRSRQRDLVTGE